MARRDRWTAGALGGLVAGAWALTGDMPASVARYPRAILVVLAVLTGVLIFSTTGPASGPGATGSVGGRSRARRVAAMAGAVAAYVASLGVLGYGVATTLGVASMMAIAGERRWGRLVAFPVASALVLHALFTGLLGVPLPPGRLVP